MSLHKQRLSLGLKTTSRFYTCCPSSGIQRQGVPSWCRINEHNVIIQSAVQPPDLPRQPDQPRPTAHHGNSRRYLLRNRLHRLRRFQISKAPAAAQQQATMVLGINVHHQHPQPRLSHRHGKCADAGGLSDPPLVRFDQNAEHNSDYITTTFD